MSELIPADRVIEVTFRFKLPVAALRERTWPIMDGWQIAVDRGKLPS